MADLTLDPPASTADLAGPPTLDDDWLVLSTVHSAKGGEWDVVHVVHAADRMFPSDMATGDADAPGEERRLFYVALTGPATPSRSTCRCATTTIGTASMTATATHLRAGS